MMAPVANRNPSQIPVTSKLPRLSSAGALPIRKKTIGAKTSSIPTTSGRPSLLVPILPASRASFISKRPVMEKRADTRKKSSNFNFDNNNRRTTFVNFGHSTAKEDGSFGARRVSFLRNANEKKGGYPSPRRSLLRPLPIASRPSLAAASKGFDNQRFNRRMSMAPQQPVQYPRARKSIYRSHKLDESSETVQFRFLREPLENTSGLRVPQLRHDAPAIIQPRRSIYAHKRLPSTPKSLVTSTPLSARKVQHRDANVSGNSSLASVKFLCPNGIRHFGLSPAHLRQNLATANHQAARGSCGTLSPTEKINQSCLRRNTLELEEFYSGFSPIRLTLELEMVDKRKAIIERILAKKRADEKPSIPLVNVLLHKGQGDDGQLETIVETKERESTSSANTQLDPGRLSTIAESKDTDSMASGNTHLDSRRLETTPEINKNEPQAEIAGPSGIQGEDVMNTENMSDEENEEEKKLTKKKGRKVRRSIGRRCIGGDGMTLRPRNRTGKC